MQSLIILTHAKLFFDKIVLRVNVENKLSVCILQKYKQVLITFKVLVLHIIYNKMS